jgi:predicted ArsR family transcriptional regulator
LVLIFLCGQVLTELSFHRLITNIHWRYSERVTAEPAIRAIAALDDDLRRGMYEFARAAHRPVTRDEAAAAVGISRKLAAFHLDKLVDAGVLRARTASAPDVRRVGRAPKVYEPSDIDIQVSLPPRRPDLLAEILLTAVLDERPRETVGDAARRVAREHGQQLGAAERDRTRPGRLGAERALTLAGQVLEQRGFEPAREAATCLRLRNCPFHPLAARAPETVCGLNLAFVAGMVDGLQAPAVVAVLDPRPGECCVELHAHGNPACSGLRTNECDE